jgi:hypothetical protein
MITTQSVNRGFHRLGLFLAAIVLVIGSLINAVLTRLNRAISGKVGPWASYPATDARMD